MVSLALGFVNYGSVLWLIEEAEQDSAPSGGFWTSLFLRIALPLPRRGLVVWSPVTLCSPALKAS